MENIGELADAAKAAGVVVALEIHGDIMASGALTLPLMESIGRDEIRVNYDTANCEFYGDVAAADDIPAIAPYLAHVHLKDKVGGARVWDFPRLARDMSTSLACSRVLRDAGYGGPYSVEIEFQGDVRPRRRHAGDDDSAYRHLSGLGLS